MLAVIGVLAVCLVIIMIEVPPMRKKGQKKELGLFSVLILLGACLSIGASLHLPIPNPLDGLNYIFKPSSDFIFGMLE
jgi:hypothetical protein